MDPVKFEVESPGSLTPTSSDEKGKARRVAKKLQKRAGARSHGPPEFGYTCVLGEFQAVDSTISDTRQVTVFPG